MKRIVIQKSSLSCPESKVSSRILGELERVGVISKKQPPAELKKVSRRKSTKSRLQSYELDPQNACAATVGKLTVAMPDKMGKETKKRRAFDDLGNKNQTLLDQKRQKKSWLQHPTKVYPKAEPLVTKTKEAGKENYGRVKTYRVLAETKTHSVDILMPTVQEKAKPARKKRTHEPNLLRSDVTKIPIPNTLTHGITEANWDLSNLSRAIDNVICEPPEGIVDIDEVCKDHFYCPDYARDIMVYLKEKEKSYKVTGAFLQEDPEVNPHMRSILIDWLVQVQNHLNLNQSTLHLTVALIDLYLMKKRVPLSKLQLIGITSLLLASKYEERFSPQIDKLVHLTDNTYDYNNVIQMEIVVLRVLQFHIRPPVATDYLDRYLMCLPIHDDLENLCRYLLDLALSDFNSIEFLPSLRAASSIYVACIVLPTVREDMESPWTEELQFYSGYKEEELFACAQRFARLLLKAPKSKFQGAREKYAHSGYKSISQFQCLCDPIVHEFAIRPQKSSVGVLHSIM